MASLSIEHDGHRYASPLDGTLKIGRAVVKGLTVTDTGVSRLHATITCQNGVYTLIDHDSKNGTYLNGQRLIGRHILKDGDRIRIGRTRLFYHEKYDTESLLICAICQTSIQPQEQTTVCPVCDLIFHCECWTENYGCSAYGCSQVNALLPGNAPELLPQEVEDDSKSVPVEYLLLAGSALAALVGALAFGSISALLLVIVLLRRRAFSQSEHRAIFLLAVGVSLIGICGGVIASYYWWL